MSAEMPIPIRPGYRWNAEHGQWDRLADHPAARRGAVYDVPRTLGPFATPERKRTFSPDDVALFRLLCGLCGKTPGQMFRKLVRDEARRVLGHGAKGDLAAARLAARHLFSVTRQRAPVHDAPSGGTVDPKAGQS